VLGLPRGCSESAGKHHRLPGNKTLLWQAGEETVSNGTARERERERERERDRGLGRGKREIRRARESERGRL